MDRATASLRTFSTLRLPKGRDAETFNRARQEGVFKLLTFLGIQVFCLQGTFRNQQVRQATKVWKGERKLVLMEEWGPGGTTPANTTHGFFP